MKPDTLRIQLDSIDKQGARLSIELMIDLKTLDVASRDGRELLTEEFNNLLDQLESKWKGKELATADRDFRSELYELHRRIDSLQWSGEHERIDKCVLRDLAIEAQIVRLEGACPEIIAGSIDRIRDLICEYLENRERRGVMVHRVGATDSPG